MRAVIFAFALVLPALLLFQADAGCPHLALTQGEDAGPCPHELPETKVADIEDQDGWWRKKKTTPAPTDGPTTPAMKLSQDVTAEGCKCKSECGSTITHKYARCDWCWTDDKCGKWSIRGHWDTCVYPSMPKFDAQDHTEKIDQIWDHITASKGKSQEVSGKLGTVKSIVTSSMIDAFDIDWEIMPTGRTKVIHKQGVHCKVDMAIAADSPFTGIFGAGTHQGIIRLGSAASLEIEEGGASIFPGYGIKFPRSGMRSANWVGLRAKGSGGSRDFFADALSNHVAPSDALIKLGKFQQASACINMVGLSEAASFGQDGKAVAEAEFPYEILFEPTGDASFMDKAKTDAQLLAELETIPTRTRLFDVYAHASPDAKSKGDKVRIGSVRTSSECTRSLFGDQELYFRHVRMEEDIKKKPHWVAQIKALGVSHEACDVDAMWKPLSTWQCSANAAADAAAENLLSQ